MAALYGAVRISQRLIGVRRTAGQRVAMAWTAITIWIEPLRSTFDYGQINVLLMLGVLWAVYTTRWWLSGLLVGVASGIKLTPAIAGVYLVGVRRLGAAVFSAVVFLATVGVSALVVGDQARYYFTDLLGDAHRVGPIATSFNQSWRGGISRILGHDAGFGPLVLAAIAVTAVLAILAWRALDTSDRLGKLLVVELFGLLLSPISWTHHWVWLVPLMIWLIHGPLRDRRGARDCGLGLVGAHHHRRAVVAELRSTDHLADQPALVSGLGRAGLHGGGAGDPDLDCGDRETRRRRRPAAGGPQSARFIAGLARDDPVDIARHVDVVLGDAALGMRNQRESHCPPTDIDIRVMIFAFGVLGHPAHRVDTGRNVGNLIDRRRAPSARSQPLRSGSAASTCSSVNTAITRRYTVTGHAEPDRCCRSGHLRLHRLGGATDSATGVGGPLGTPRRQGRAAAKPSAPHWRASWPRNWGSRSRTSRWETAWATIFR